MALQEGLLYHFSRVDHRHNYSMHWYWIYLARAANVDMTNAGRLLLFPQIILLAYSSLGVAPHNLTLALFLQTFLFVAHNKVITAQYFTWYLCLLPLCIDQFCWTRRVKISLTILLFSMVIWLASAYCLEMQGMAIQEVVWTASVVFFAANVNLHGAMLASIRHTNSSGPRTKHD
jgi:phosphatidylinositol glycan class M